MTLQLIGHNYAYEMECLLRLFYPGEKIAVVQEAGDIPGDLVRTEVRPTGQGIALRVLVRIEGHCLEANDLLTEPRNDLRDTELRLGALVFFQLCEVTKSRPPWGILTGVRPVRLLRKLADRFSVSYEEARDIFVEKYHVSPQKADLALSTLMTQGNLIDTIRPDSYSLYVNIPFCPTRCLYCSFVSHAIDRARRLLCSYLECLRQELAAIGTLAKDLKLCLRTVYIGGGTPTVLSPEELDSLLEWIKNSFPVSGISEYTVEAGRPDSISREKLTVLKNHGVNRISVNPQTMNDEILGIIGRSHTAAQTEDAYRLAREMGFDAVNMDLIAGLPGEIPDSFVRTLKRVITMRPENLTVHTLTVKRSADLRSRDDAFAQSPYNLGELLTLSQQMLSDAGYAPYYLYRQQGTRQNHENTGFSLPGKEGLYNIYSMEDAQTILAAGAGGVTKLCRDEAEMKRVFNYKYPYEYIANFKTILARKQMIREFFTEHVRKG